MTLSLVGAPSIPAAKRHDQGEEDAAAGTRVAVCVGAEDECHVEALHPEGYQEGAL
jgi:hypothetical protein